MVANDLLFLVAHGTAKITNLFLRSSGAGSIQGQSNEAAVVKRLVALRLMDGGDRRLARRIGVEPFGEVTVEAAKSIRGAGRKAQGENATGPGSGPQRPGGCGWR